MKHLIIIVCELMIFTSCDSNTITEKEDLEPFSDSQPVAAQDTTSNIIDVNNEKKYPEITSFKQSECKENCELVETIKAKTLSNHTLSIGISAIRDCSTQYKVDSIIHKKDLIDIQISSTTPDIITECYCLYNFDLKIKNIDTIPRNIKLNGKSINKNYSTNY